GPDPGLGNTNRPLDSQMSPTPRGPAASSATEPSRAGPAASTLPLGEPAKSLSGIDFGALDFDLGPTKSGTDGAPALPPAHEEHQASPSPKQSGNLREAPTVPSIDLMFESTTPAARRAGPPTAT